MRATQLYVSLRYELIAFLTGAAVMVLEIVGGRLIAPVFGMSTYVWTAMIGVILASLAVGYTLGGKLADRDNSAKFLGLILFMAALLVLLMGLVQRPGLEFIAAWHADLRLSALVAASLLFGLPSALIGMVSPHLAKLKVTSLQSTGYSIGRLEAAGALGSILGTFSCGYFLLGAFGSRSIIIGVVIVLLLTSVIAGPRSWMKIRLYALVATFFMTFLINANPAGVVVDVDSSYARYQVLKGLNHGSPAYALIMDRFGMESAAVQGNPTELLFAYARQFRSAFDDYKTATRVLVIGGGTYTFPTYLVHAHPDVKVAVAEIDPALDGLAVSYFNYRPSARLAVHHVDGRTYLNQNRTTYDMVFMDAFSSLSPPFQLTTSQAVQRIADSLSPNGVVVVNVVASYQNGDNSYVRALAATYQNVFEHIAFYPLDESPGPTDTRTNIVLIASNDDGKFNALTKPMRHDPLRPKAGGILLTDDYAPIEQLTFQ